MPLRSERYPQDPIAALLDLQPRNATRRLRGVFARVLPDPLKSYEAWERFTHRDLARMSPQQRAHERHRLVVAIATSSPTPRRKTRTGSGVASRPVREVERASAQP